MTIKFFLNSLIIILTDFKRLKIERNNNDKIFESIKDYQYWNGKEEGIEKVYL